MKIKDSRPIQQMIEDQVRKWKAGLPHKEEKGKKITVITVSRQPGSGGHHLAKLLAKELGFDFFDQEITVAIAENTHMRTQWVESLDEKRHPALDDIISAVLEKHHLWSYEYMQNLVKVIATIGEHGNAVILGRGAHFILPREGNLRVRVVASLEIRVKNLAEWLKISSEQAKEYIKKSELDRADFIKNYFKADINDPKNFDLVINMEKLSFKNATEVVKAALKSS